MGSEPFSWSVAGTLELGERVQAFTRAEVRVGKDALFEPAEVILSDHRLVFLFGGSGGGGGAEPWMHATERKLVAPIRLRERSDGSVIVVLRSGRLIIGLLVQEWDRGDAEPLLEALGLHFPHALIGTM